MGRLGYIASSPQGVPRQWCRRQGGEQRAGGMGVQWEWHVSEHGWGTRRAGQGDARTPLSELGQGTVRPSGRQSQASS